jgi:hypothetical protein
VTLAEATRQYQDALEAHRAHGSDNTREQLDEAWVLMLDLWSTVTVDRFVEGLA